MNIILSKRLRLIAGMVPDGSVPADIGTDHGYIPICLVQEGKAPRALAMDVRPGPLERAAGHIESCGLSDRITVRLSDGLENLQPGEADTLIIAGMGGALIERILTQGKCGGRLEGIRHIILGPQSEPARVRSWILRNGFAFGDEEMVEEDGKYYPVIRAVPCGDSPEEMTVLPETAPARADLPDLEGKPVMCGEDPVLLEYGPVLLAKRHPVLLEYLVREESLCERIRQQILANASPGANEDRLEELGQRLERIRCAKAFYGN